MRPEGKSQRLLGVTRSKAKMWEYGVPEEDHIRIPDDPAQLFTLAIGLLGDLAARTNSKDADEDYLEVLRGYLSFSAHFFDAYLESRLKNDLDPYLTLLGSASYYLSDLPGSSLVLAKQLSRDGLDIECDGLEDLLLWLLQGDLSYSLDRSSGLLGKQIAGISLSLTQFLLNGCSRDSLFKHASDLRTIAYDKGTPRQLLLADVICAVIKKRFKNSTWHCLPNYSNTSIEEWKPALLKETFIRELWPAQHLIGKHGVFLGKSAVIQMPTSAGKTKAVEIILRSSFIAERTSLAVIVAPFRALCQEIRNDLAAAFSNEPVNVNGLSDVLQMDFELAALLGRKQILIVTPEKLVYVLRHTPGLAAHIGLLIYDEGHQFDSGTRGITYELLLTSLKAVVPEPVQTILISAVISNASSVGNWLSGEDYVVVSGTNLVPTYRTLAFASWQDLRGRPLAIGWLRFVDPKKPDINEFFVPRVIEQSELQLKGREYKPRIFPERADGQAIALFLGLKLASSGSVALFCGTKATVSKLCNEVIDKYERGLALARPIEFSNREEVARLRYLHERNLGSQSTATMCTALGIFSHHANSPHGIRLAVEHAMKEGLAKFVICTSTLAQGVNLPIRYLIVTSIYQGKEQIKVRDFHNLIGRAGRSGMHTEGSIIFTDPTVYDKRTSRTDSWRWKRVKDLLEPANSEPCASTLSSIFEPLHSDNKKTIIPMEPLDFVRVYIESPESLNKLAENIASRYSVLGITAEELSSQISWKANIISSVESYLMAHWSDNGDISAADAAEDLSRGTLAYSLADEEQQTQIIELFRLLSQNIVQNVSEVSKRQVFGRTLFGLQTSIAIENWVSDHIELLTSCSSQDELFAALWPVIAEHIQNKTFRKCDPASVLRDVATEWIHGCPFYELFAIVTTADAKRISKSRRYQIKLEHVIEICEGAFAYDATLVLGAVTEFSQLVNPDLNGSLVNDLQVLQKRLKYGLSSSSAIALYELGFADRVVAMTLDSTLDAAPESGDALMLELKRDESVVRRVLSKYPSYFTRVLDDLLNRT